MSDFYNRRTEGRVFYIEEIKPGLFQSDKILVLKSWDSVDPEPVPEQIKEVLDISGEFCTGRLPVSLEISETEFIKRFGNDKYEFLKKYKVVDLEIRR